MSKVANKASKTKYRITLSKKFEYPSSVVDENNYLRDVADKAIGDFMDNIERDGLHLEDFTTEVESELPYKVDLKLSKEDREFLSKPVAKTRLDYYIREFCIADVVAKYGVLDHIQNETIFNKVETPIYDDDDNVIDHEYEYYINSEVESFWADRTNHYVAIIRRIGL